MNILVLNGSPKGEYSITLQTVRYLEKQNPQHSFQVLHVGRQIKSIEKDFSKARELLLNAELILFSYPVYTFIAPYQMHRFIELMKESGIDFSNRFATQITTSKHFYDVTAHRYIQENCQDMGMKFIRGLSADMDDLLKKKGQNEAEAFFAYACWCMDQDIYEKAPILHGEGKRQAISVPGDTMPDKPGDVVVLTNCSDDDDQLKQMIARFQSVMHRKTRVINLLEYPFKGGCLGCFNCAASGKCIYKDGFDTYLRENIQTAEAIVYAFTIRDHSMGASFKLYDDRQFCNGHRTVTMGMPIGYLVSGDYSREMNLQTIIEGRCQVGSNFLAGVATDEVDPDGQIDAMAASVQYALEHRYVPPQNFYGIGGMKIFRDLIWLMRGMMKADHKFYKKHGQYDFPQKKWPMMIKMYLVGGLISNPKIKAKMGNAMNEGMLMPYKKLLEDKK